MKNNLSKLIGSLCLIVVLLPATAWAQTQADAEALKEANNPLASIKTANLHNYYMPKMFGVPDATYNQTWIRYAQPIGSFIIRASMPFETVSAANAEPETGLGDMNIFGIYKFKSKNPGIELGIGPTLTLPTGTNDMGAGKWQAGVSAIAFFKSSPIIQVGSLVTWQTSFAGNSDRDDVSMLTPQLFFMWQVGGGTYLRSTGVWTFDLESGSYNVPIGLGVGKVIKAGRKTFNIFMEPQYSVLTKGMGQPQLQVFIGFNTQFR